MPVVEIAAGISIDVPAAPWNEYDRAAWHWPEPMLPSEWSEKYRILDRGAIPGPWRNDNAPYLVGVMDLAAKRGVIRLVIKKAAQLGVSEAMRNVMGYWAHMDPAAIGLALPNKEKGREIVENDVLPFFQSTFSRHRQLRNLLSHRLHDMKKGQIKLANSFIMHLMWSGSPASMASNPMKKAVSDEVDKFEEWAGNDADPVSLIEYRMRTEGDRMHALVSTPTLETAAISQNFNACGVKLYYLVGCPHCRLRQRLLFGEGGTYGVKFSQAIRELQLCHEFDAAATAALADPDAVWYECCGCHGKISERQKRQLVRAGKWGTVGEDLMTADGRIEDVDAIKEFPRGTWVGMQISALYCMWEGCTLAHVAAEFLRARTYAQKFAFRTSTLGESWEQMAKGNEKVSIESAAQGAVLAEGILPWWTARLLATIDTQKDHFWVVIRAWGPGMRSQRIWHNRVESFADLERICFKTPFANEDKRLPARVCDLAFIDSGGTRHEDAIRGDSGIVPPPSRVMEVYRWALENQARVRAIKGNSHPHAGEFIKRGVGDYVADGRKGKVPLFLLSVHHFQDYLVDLMKKRVGGEASDMRTGEVMDSEEDAGMPIWRLNTRNDSEYSRHMGNMHKVCRGVGADMEWRWEPLREGLRVDYRAIEGYQVAAAEMAEVPMLPELGAWRKYLEQQLAARQRPAERAENQFLTSDGRPYLATER
jgi:hypothetical protein